MNSYLIACPEYDLYTHIVAPWTEDVTNAIRDDGPYSSLEILRGRDAIRSTVEELLPQFNVLVFFGHGFNDSLCAHPIPLMSGATQAVTNQLARLKDFFFGRSTRAVKSGSKCKQALIDRTNHGLLDGKFIYAVACSAAFDLGHSVVRRSPGIFFGYHEEYWVHPDTRHLFRECANAAILSMQSSGLTAHDAYAHAIYVYDRVIANFEIGGPGSGLYDAPEIVTLLKHDRFRLVRLGEPNRSIF